MLKDARATYTPGLSERAGSTSSFYHGDALGSTRGITSASQAVTDAILYDAFGATVSRTGSTATPFGFVGAQGYQSDADSGLMLLGNRYYDASIGRFISSDPAMAGSNWYAYCENGPIAESDATGLDFGPGIGDHDTRGGVGIVGGTPAERAAIVRAIGRIRRTRTGGRLLRPYRPGGGMNLVIDISAGEQNNARTTWPPDFIPPDPKRKGRATGPGNAIIIIDPEVIDDPSLIDRPYDPGNDLAVIIAHELGHANGWWDDGPGNMNNVNDNENKYRREVGKPRRTRYGP